MASQLTGFAVVAFSIAAAFFLTQCTAQDCPLGTFSAEEEGSPENQTAGQLNCSSCHPLCTECFGPGADECLMCMAVFVASGRMRDGRTIVECLFTCSEGFGLSSSTLECMQVAPQTVNGLGQAGIAALCVCVLIATALLFLTLFLLRERYTRWVAHRRKEVDLNGGVTMEMNNVDTIVNEFAYVADPDNTAKLIKMGEAGNAQHLLMETETASEPSPDENGECMQERLAAQGYMQMSQVHLLEGPAARTEGGSASLSKSAAHRKQEVLAAQGYITMATASRSKKGVGAGEEYITMHSAASHVKEEEATGVGEEYITMTTASHSKKEGGVGEEYITMTTASRSKEGGMGEEYITMHSAVSHVKEEEATRVGEEYITMTTASHSKKEVGVGEEYITMHSTASHFKEDEATGVGTNCNGEDDFRKRAGSSWLLSKAHHNSLPRRGYSVSRSASCVTGKEVRGRADSVEGQDHVHRNRCMSIGGMSHHYEQLRDRTTSQTSSSHYEVLDGESHAVGSMDDGYDRVRASSATGRDSIYWYASSGPLLPPRRSRQPTLDSEYVAMQPQLPKHRAPAPLQHVYERPRPPGLPDEFKEDDAPPHNYYNLDDTRTL